MEKRETLIKNEYLFAILTKIATVVFGLINSILFARFVGSSLKGDLTYITSVVATGSVIMSMGVHHAYPFYRKKAAKIEDFITAFSSTCFFMFAVFLFLGLGVAFVINQLLSIRHIFLMVSLMVLWSYNRVIGYIVLVETPNKKNTAVMCFTFVEMLIVLFFFVFLEATFILGVICVIICQVLEFLFYTWCLRKHIQLSGVNVKFLFRLIVYGFFPMLALLMNTLNYKIDVFMLKGYGFISDSHLGVYSIGIALAEKVLLIPDAIQEILLSKLAKNKGANEVALVCRLTFPLSLLIALVIIILGEPFIHYLYGVEYDGAYLVTVISVIGTAFMVFYKMISQYNIVSKKQKQNVVLLSLGIVINVILNCIFVPFWGINGAAVATSIGYAICSLLFIISFSRNAQLSIVNIIMINKTDVAFIKNLVFKSKWPGNTKME